MVSILVNKTINIRVQKRMLDWIDSLVDEGLFNSRSEAVREFTREAMDDKK